MRWGNFQEKLEMRWTSSSINSWSRHNLTFKSYLTLHARETGAVSPQPHAFDMHWSSQYILRISPSDSHCNCFGPNCRIPHNAPCRDTAQFKGIVSTSPKAGWAWEKHYAWHEIHSPHSVVNQIKTISRQRLLLNLSKRLTDFGPSFGTTCRGRKTRCSRFQTESIIPGSCFNALRQDDASPSAFTRSNAQ